MADVLGGTHGAHHTLPGRALLAISPATLSRCFEPPPPAVPARTFTLRIVPDDAHQTSVGTAQLDLCDGLNRPLAASAHDVENTVNDAGDLKGVRVRKPRRTVDQDVV